MRRLIGFLKHHRRLLLSSSLHSAVLAMLTYFWMSLSFEFGDAMVRVARVNQIVQYLLLDKPDSLTEALKKNIILVNCSYDKMLVPFENDQGSGTRAVINRRLLAELIRVIQPSKPEMVIWDIFLDNPSDDDSALYAELQQVSPLIMSSYLNTDGTMNRPHAGMNYARAQYATTIGSFLKYQLLDSDSIKYVPAVMYEEATGDTLYSLGPLVWSSQALWLNAFIVDLSIRKAHIESNDVVMWNLGDVLKYTPASEIQSLTTGKIVVIGDFYEFDNHETLLGIQPGPLIIVNTYLGLLKGVPRTTFWEFCLVFILYFACTLYILRFQTHRRKLNVKKAFKGKVMKFMLRYFSYLVLFSVYTIVLYLITQKHFELIMFALYFNVFEYIVRKYRTKVDRLLYGYLAENSAPPTQP